MVARARADRLERLTNLVLVLLETPRPLSLREIASSVAGYPDSKEACRQAFERDKRELRGLGIQIAVEPVAAESQVGYRIRPEDYYLSELHLEPDEAHALGFAVASVQLTGGAGRDALAKLGATSEVPEPGLPPLAVLPDLPALVPLHEALRDRSTVTFGYHDRARQVEPYGLVLKQSAWYLVGRDRTVPGEALRTFRVDRFQDEPVVGPAGDFERPSDFDLRNAVRLAPWQTLALEHDSAPVEVQAVIDVDARLARSAAAVVGQGAVTSWTPDGAVRLSIPVTDEAHLLDWVIGLGDTAEVVAPPELRAATRRRLEQFVAVPDPSRGAPPRGSFVAPSPGDPPPATTATTATSAITGHRPEATHEDASRPSALATAGARLDRLLAILVHLSRVGEEGLGALAARFSMSESDLVRELELAACCGVPPYTPDQLIDLLVDDDRVVADGLRELGSPRRLTPEEGFALAAAARALLAVPGADGDGALSGALGKLEAALGASPLSIDVDQPPSLTALRQAVVAGAQVEIDYFASSATEPAPRRVDPLQVVVREGRWYLDAWCGDATGLRRFQVDRVQSVRQTGAASRQACEDLDDRERSQLARPEAFLGGAGSEPVTLAVEPRARFAVEGIASGPIVEHDDGRLRVTVLVGDVAGWFGRLLLRLGADAEVVDPPRLANARSEAAERALKPYLQ